MNALFMDTASLANLISSIFQCPVSCNLKEEENQIIIRVFCVPEERKDGIEDAIYDLERGLLPERDFFFSVILYSPDETKRYYPEMSQLKRPMVCEEGQESRLQGVTTIKTREYYNCWTQTQNNVCDQFVYAA
ncbi:MAG: hypothetical protein GX568_07760 [Candidatus Gastranaerophilales bacterium]|nr:hypothetical protein [Candidatus Gastranaerophilales bacterium]